MLLKNYFTLIFLSILVFGFANATAPTPPHQFYGNVTVNGVPAENGIIISAEVDGYVKAQASTVNGQYGVASSFLIPNKNYADNTISFFVTFADKNISVAQFIFKSGELTKLDLGITPETCGDGSCNYGETCSSCPADCGACDTSGGTGGTGGGGGGGGSGGGGGGGGSGGGGGGGSYTCIDQWECSEWQGICVNEGDSQTRTCTKTNYCRGEENKPTEVRNCVFEQPIVGEGEEAGEGEETVETPTTPTGGTQPSTPTAFAGLAGNAGLIAGGIIVIVIVFGSLYYVFYYGKKKVKR